MSLAEFARAPEPVQRDFWRDVGRRAAWEQRLARYRMIVRDEAAAPPIVLRRCEPRRPRWGDRWRRRARRYERAREAGREASSRQLERERGMLHRVDPPEYVERLTGEVPDRGRKIRCPLPTHDERTPSFYVNPTPERGWHCFGCGADGDIYTLAGLLWGHGDHGRDWWNTHQRLVRIFL